MRKFLKLCLSEIDKLSRILRYSPRSRCLHDRYAKHSGENSKLYMFDREKRKTAEGGIGNNGERYYLEINEILKSFWGSRSDNWGRTGYVFAEKSKYCVFVRGDSLDFFEAFQENDWGWPNHSVLKDAIGVKCCLKDDEFEPQSSNDSNGF